MYKEKTTAEYYPVVNNGRVQIKHVYACSCYKQDVDRFWLLSESLFTSLSLRGSQAGWAATFQVKWSHQHLGKPQTALTASLGFTAVAGAR